MTSLIDAVYRFLSDCPVLTEGRLNVDFLPEEAVSYSVDVTPATPVLRRYIDGGSLRQFLFTFATRSYYGEVIRQQLDNLGLFERFADWLEAKSRAGELPALGEGRRARRLEVTTSGYVFAPETDTARYQIQCRLLYEQDAEYENKEI